MKTPRITIVTPSYNQAQFIEETILSIIDQGYPNLEYIIMDGGSKDGTVDILKKYSDRISYWVSEKDDGQSDAINKGFARATGEICAYLNSDDCLLPGSLMAIAGSYNEHNWKWCYSPILVGPTIGQSKVWDVRNFTPEEFYVQQLFGQQGVFWRADAMEKPYFRKEFRYAMDAEFFCRMIQKNGIPPRVPFTTGFFRIHPDSKTSTIDHVLASEGRKIYSEIYRKADSTQRLALRRARRQKALRQLSARLQQPFYDSHTGRRLALSFLMLRKATNLVSLRMGMSQVVRSLLKSIRP